MEFKREKYLNNHPRSLSKIQIKRIYEQMNKSICKIVDYKGTGFLCRIPYPNNLNLLPVLITCNHVLENKYIKPGKEIKLVFEEEEKIEPYFMIVELNGKKVKLVYESRH